MILSALKESCGCSTLPGPLHYRDPSPTPSHLVENRPSFPDLASNPRCPCTIVSGAAKPGLLTPSHLPRLKQVHRGPCLPSALLSCPSKVGKFRERPRKDNRLWEGAWQLPCGRAPSGVGRGQHQGWGKSVQQPGTSHPEEEEETTGLSAVCITGLGGTFGGIQSCPLLMATPSPPSPQNPQGWRLHRLSGHLPALPPVLGLNPTSASPCSPPASHQPPNLLGLLFSKPPPLLCP